MEEEIENQDAAGQGNKEQAAYVNEDITSQSTTMSNAPEFVSMEAFASGLVAGNAIDTSAVGIGPDSPLANS